jgi:FKBP-type peptidyl-prolyl cis-trans isomerase
MILLGVVWILMFSWVATAEQTITKDRPDEKKEINVLESADLIRQISYALGYDIFKNVSRYMDLDLASFIKGVNDNHKGELTMEKEQLGQMLMAYQRIARQKQMETMKQASETNRVEEARFLEGNKLKQGVISLSSGLQYKILAKGKGPLPEPNDTVECNYKGSLLDGTVFDSSFTRGKPAVFQVNGVIPGWVEALQLMPVGSRWELYVPADLAYGDQGAGDAIKPGQTLIFEVELLGIIE